MSKKKDKLTATDKELLRRAEKYRNPFSNSEPLDEYCKKIKKEADEDFNDCSYTNLNDGEQYLPSGFHQFTEAVVMASPLYSDHGWIKSGEENTTDDEFFIGKINDPITGILQLRAFWRRKIEEIGEYRFCELESLYTVALAYYSFDTHTNNGEGGYTTTLTYALITGFFNGKMLEWEFYEIPSIVIIKEFISDISAALKSNPKNRCCDMPKKEMFTELIEKLMIVPKSVPISTVGESNAITGNVKISRAHFKKFDKQFKMDIVKRIKAKQLTERQAAKEVGIHSSGIYQWVREYEKNGENAFRGRGRESPKKMNTDTPDRNTYDRRLKMAAVKLVKEHNQPLSQVEKNLGIGEGNLRQWIRQYEKNGENSFRGSGSFSPLPDKRKLIEEIFKDEIAEAAVPHPIPGSDDNKYNILNLPHDKEKMLETCAYKLRKYDKAFKIKTVERIKEHQLPIPQVSEKLGIDVSLLRDWVVAYEKSNETKVCDDAPAQNDTTGAISLFPDSDTVTDSTTDNDANKKKVASDSNKKPVYDKKYKMAAVNYVNENNLSAIQVAKELNIPYISLNRWVRLYKKHGEDAFPGSGVYHEP